MKARKILVSVAALALVAALSIAGTLAYLTDKGTVTNTFTVGNIGITLDEALVNDEGKAVKKNTDNTLTPVDKLEEATRVAGNSYHLLPGHSYTKDPTVTVAAKSEEAYLRILVTVDDMTKLTSAFPQDKNAGYYNNGVILLEKLVDWDSSNTVWEFHSYTAGTGTDKSGTYEFRYKANGKDTYTNATANAVALQPLFTKVIVPDGVDNDQLSALNNVQITIVAEAIQASGFEASTTQSAADVAWAAFDAQYNKT